MNFEYKFKQGLEGLNFGLPMGIPSIDTKVGGIQREAIYGIAAGPKVGKCLAKGTLVRMYDMTLKKVEDILPTELLLGIDGLPNRVLDTTKGRENMYRVEQSKSMDYVCNESHILSLKHKGEVTHISVKDFIDIKSEKSKKRDYKGYKSVYEGSHLRLKLDPYMLGLWLGDGTTNAPEITNIDKEIITYLESYCNVHGMKLSKKADITYYLGGRKTYYYGDNIFFSGKDLSNFLGFEDSWVSHNLSRGVSEYRGIEIRRKVKHGLKTQLQYYNLLGNKHIPNVYKNCSKDNRLKLLAGLIDSDGHLTKKGYEITQKSKNLILDIKFISDSLGFNTTLSKKKIEGKVYYKLYISGKTHKIPVLIERKKSKVNIKSNDSSIRVVSLGEGEYYGFTLENEDKRFYLEDFTVTHNTTFTDYSFVLSPAEYYLHQLSIGNPLGLEVEWIYFSYEISRVKKEFKYVTFYMARDYGITTFDWKNEVHPLTPNYLEGRMRDNDDERIIPSEEHQRIVMEIYRDKIIPLFGQYDKKGAQIKKGLINFVEYRENPTGLRNYIGDYSSRNGTWTKSVYYTDGVDNQGKKVRIKHEKRESWIPNNPKKFTIIILDHLRKLKEERGFNKKQTVDKMIEYQVEFRNWCGFTFVDIIHLNRSMSDVQRLKYNKEFIYPTGDDIKETGNLSEEANYIFTMMNPNDDKYGLDKHFGLQIKNSSNDELYPNYISIHLVESRDSECPMHFRTIMRGNINKFEPLVELSGYGNF